MNAWIYLRRALSHESAVVRKDAWLEVEARVLAVQKYAKP